MLRGGKHGHIHSDFRDDADSGKGLDTRRRHNKAQLRKILLGGCQNQRFQICFAQSQAVHVKTDNAELFSLLGTHLSVHGSKHLFIDCFHALSTETGNICDFLCWILQNSVCNRRRGLPKDIRKHIVQLEVGDGQAVLRPVFSPVVKLVSFQR